MAIKLGTEINLNKDNNKLAATALICAAENAATDDFSFDVSTLLSFMEEKIRTLSLNYNGLHLKSNILDPENPYTLNIIGSSNLTANRGLLFDVMDGNRTIQLSGNPTLDDWFNQSVKTTADVTHNSLTAATINTGEVISSTILFSQFNAGNAYIVRDNTLQNKFAVYADHIDCYFPLRVNTIEPDLGSQEISVNEVLIGPGTTAQSAVMKYFIDNKAVIDTYEITSLDNGVLMYHALSANSSITFPGDPSFPGRTLPDGFFCIIENRNSNGATLTINTTEGLEIYSGLGPNPSSTSIVLQPGEAIQIIKTGWQLASALTPPNGGNSGQDTFDNGELGIRDNDKTHKVTFYVDADLTDNHTLTLLTNDDNRILSLTGDVALNQDLLTTSQPSFPNVFTDVITPRSLVNDRVSIIDLAIYNATFDKRLLINYVDSPIEAAKVLNLSTNNQNVDFTISDDSVINQDVSTSGSPTHANLTTTTAVITDTISERTSAAGITADSVLLKDGGITLATSGGTATALNYYEEYTHSTTFTWGSHTTGSFDIKVTRIGKKVSIQLPIIAISSTQNGFITANTALPARFRPTNDVWGLNFCSIGGTAAKCLFIALSTGILQFKTDGDAAINSTAFAIRPPSVEFVIQT